MKKIIYSAILVSALAACNTGTANTENNSDSLNNPIETKSDSLSAQAEESADSARARLEKSSDSVKEQLKEAFEKTDSLPQGN